MHQDEQPYAPSWQQAGDAVARQQQVFDRGPRIVPLPVSEVGPEGAEIVRSLQQAAGLPETAAIPEVVATLLRHPILYEKHAAIGAELLGRGALAPRHRELAILRTGWLCGAPFEWGEHVAIGRRAGLSAAEIDALTKDADLAEWDEPEWAIAKAAEELHRDATISDAVWSALATFLNEAGLIELVYVIGHYTKVAYLQNALRLRLPPGNDGLFAR